MVWVKINKEYASTTTPLILMVRVSAIPEQKYSLQIRVSIFPELRKWWIL